MSAPTPNQIRSYLAQKASASASPTNQHSRSINLRNLRQRQFHLASISRTLGPLSRVAFQVHRL